MAEVFVITEARGPGFSHSMKGGGGGGGGGDQILL